MSKELTEKLENYTLETGYYYAQMYEFDEDDDEVNDIFTGIIEVNDGLVSYIGDGVDEVLEPVPTYYEYQKLKERLADADKTIKWYDGLENIFVGWEMCTGQPEGTAKKYLDKWGVK